MRAARGDRPEYAGILVKPSVLKDDGVEAVLYAVVNSLNRLLNRLERE